MFSTAKKLNKKRKTILNQHSGLIQKLSLLSIYIYPSLSESYEFLGCTMTVYVFNDIPGKKIKYEEPIKAPEFK